MFSFCNDLRSRIRRWWWSWWTGWYGRARYSKWNYWAKPIQFPSIVSIKSLNELLWFTESKCKYIYKIVNWYEYAVVGEEMKIVKRRGYCNNVYCISFSSCQKPKSNMKEVKRNAVSSNKKLGYWTRILLIVFAFRLYRFWWRFTINVNIYLILDISWHFILISFYFRTVCVIWEQLHKY